MVSIILHILLRKIYKGCMTFYDLWYGVDFDPTPISIDFYGLWHVDPCINGKPIDWNLFKLSFLICLSLEEKITYNLLKSEQVKFQVQKC